MVKGKGSKLGDTLVEVTLAIGIFSMVAIAAVSVISAATSSTQNILENTLTREQIDSQAEALRFIQAAYTAEGERDQDNLTKYGLLWQTVSSHAISLEGLDAVSDDIKKNILNYNPTTCSELYSSDAAASIVKQNAFLININALGSDINKDTVSSVVVPARNGTSLSSKFRSATTYPHIVYGAADSINDPLYDPSTATNLYTAEGLFVVAVKDTSGTMIVSDDTGNIGSISAYIDFYIRSCWFATGSERPTTISTAIRLYNPDTVSINKYDRKGVIVKYEKGGDGVTGTMPSQYILSGTSASPLANRYERPGYKFAGWATAPNGAVEYAVNSDGTFSKMYQANNTTNENTTVTLYAVWNRLYTLTWHQNIAGTVNDMPSNLSVESTNSSYNLGIVPDNTPFYVRTNASDCKAFTGWSTSPGGSANVFIGNQIIATAANPNINYYATWAPIHCRDYQIRLTWGASPSDLDSHFVAEGGENYYVWYNNKNTVNANLDVDDTDGGGPEVITLDVEPNTTYNYYVHCYAKCFTGMEPAKVELIDAYDGRILRAYTSPTLNGKASWNVLRITTNADGQATITDLSTPD